MGIQSAMYSGISGLNTNSQAMSVIGNNLANTNTVGFKSSRTVFSDLLSFSVSASGGPSQVGRGVGLSSIDRSFAQGTFAGSSSSTDVAIEGQGFFMVKNPGLDDSYYTRAGSFRFDDNGYLVNPEGFRVQGKAFDSIRNTQLLPGDPTDIRVSSVGLLEASPTTELTFLANLNQSSTALGAGAIDPTDKGTYSYSSSAEIFDSFGESHLVNVYWRLEDRATNTWSTGYTIDNGPCIALTNKLEFDAKGRIESPNADGLFAQDIAITWPNGAEAQTITLGFDCTQFDSASTVIGQRQNGYPAGELTNVGINGSGTVIASYSNGRHINISQLMLAKFQNPGGLEAAGNGLFTAPPRAVGAIRIGEPGPELGKIFANSLEQSNVDMSLEFVNMITNQRGFQANSKIITTVDEMLSELINLKR